MLPIYRKIAVMRKSIDGIRQKHDREEEPFLFLNSGRDDVMNREGDDDRVGEQ